MEKNIEMFRIITLIILISFNFSCKNTDYSKESITIIKDNKEKTSQAKSTINPYFGLSKFDLLTKLEKDIDNKKTSYNFYRALDSINDFVDGADSEYYIEIYAKAIINDCEKLKKYLEKENIDIDINTISFFTKSESYSKNISKSIKKCGIQKGENKIIQDTDGFVNLREGPNSNFDIIKKINNGEMVQCIFRNNNKWKIVITSDNLIGYIHSSRLKPIK